MKAALYEKHRSARQLMEDVFEQETTGSLLPKKKKVKQACATDLEHVKNRLNTLRLTPSLQQWRNICQRRRYLSTCGNSAIDISSCVNNIFVAVVDDSNS